MKSENAEGRSALVLHDRLARRVVARVAPDELAAFPLLAGPYLGDSRRGARRAARDRPLGSGLSEVSGAVTPVVVVVTGWAVTALAGGAAEEIKGRGMRLTKALLDGLWRRRRNGEAVEVPVEALSEGQLRAVHTSVQAKAEQLGMDAVAAGVLADAVVGELVLLRADGSQEPAP
ncbi:hypothetical protein [Streptomyces pinistramenti]|uniref:hypothetical protein n=1 Tax=Streptomyces pinistramenti TaxID=2884812 RepID=UPI001D065C6C|nr:hypothetical protein [Streptomyces pinistramenti]MCB5909254.1 hypothetical protein [Streptomyces pinistramenti]